MYYMDSSGFIKLTDFKHLGFRGTCVFSRGSQNFENGIFTVFSLYIATKLLEHDHTHPFGTTSGICQGRIQRF